MHAEDPGDCDGGDAGAEADDGAQPGESEIRGGAHSHADSLNTVPAAATSSPDDAKNCSPADGKKEFIRPISNLLLKINLLVFLSIFRNWCRGTRDGF